MRAVRTMQENSRTCDKMVDSTGQGVEVSVTRGKYENSIPVSATESWNIEQMCRADT